MARDAREEPDFETFLRKGVEGISACGVERIQLLTATLLRVLEAGKPSSADAIANKTARELGVEVEHVSNALAFLDFFSRPKLLQIEPQEAARELRESFIGTDIKQLPDLESVVDASFTALRQIGSQLPNAIGRGTARIGVIPSLEGIATTVEVRGAFAADFGQADEGRFAGFVGIASIRVDLDSGMPDSFSFQVTREDLDELIRNLEVVKSQLEQLELKVGKG